MTSTDSAPELHEVLDDLTYPADKARIVTCTQVHGFDHTTRRLLHRLPARVYRSAEDVTDELADELPDQQARGSRR